MSTPNEPPEESAREFPLPGSFLEALHKRTKEDLLQKMNVTSVEVSYLQACRIFQKLQKDFDLNNAGVSFQPYSEQQPLPPKYFEKLIHGIERPTYIQTTFFESDILLVIDSCTTRKSFRFTGTFCNRFETSSPSRAVYVRRRPNKQHIYPS
jgi:hypothetical protein